MSSFPAKYHTLCLPCGEDIKRGDFIRMHPQAGAVHEECWDDVGNIPETDREPHNPDDPTTTTHPVMPRGKSASDRCDGCFMVHSPGQDGCE